MRNFAEELAYLYFRLNGFFLLENYITNREEIEAERHTESDLIGIRTSNVYEEVGLNQDVDTDAKLQRLINGYEFIGLVCEVKGGQHNNWDLGNNKIMACINRIGLVNRGNENEIRQVYEDLIDGRDAVFCNGHRKIIKVVVSDNPPPDIPEYWHHFSLNELLDFIERRVHRYNEKIESWYLSSSSIFQYLLFKNRGNE